MQPITILIADDDPLVRQCLRRAVEQDARLRILWEADDGLKALCLAHEHHPHVILLDADMPRMDGIEAARFLRQRCHAVRILVMSVYEQHRGHALAAGADAFLMKDAGCAAIRAAIHQLLADKPNLSQDKDGLPSPNAVEDADM